MATAHWSVLALVTTSAAAAASCANGTTPSGTYENALDGSTGLTEGDGGGAKGAGASSSGSGSGGQQTGSSSNGGSSSGSGSGSSSGSTVKKDAGSSSSSGSSSGGTVMTTGSGAKIPAVSGTCPTIATGTITVLGQQVQIWAGKKGDTPAPIVFYWHGTGSSATEAEAFMSAQISEVTGEGGVFASFTTSTAMGTDTGDAVWYTGD